jgi:hypothetical protein
VPRIAVLQLKTDKGWQKRLFFAGENPDDIARLQFLCDRMAEKGISPAELLSFARTTARQMGWRESAH